MEEPKDCEYTYELIFTDYILDNIYGKIGLTEVERKIERLPLFKRLHDISQLGLVKYIFPCAVHTRYVHSIGVMQMIYDMATHINSNYYKEHQENLFNKDELQILRLAGMLHDIGHYPLSHNIEAAYMDTYDSHSVNTDIDYAKIQKKFTGCPDFCLVEENKKEDDENVVNRIYKYSKKYSNPHIYNHEKIGAEIITRDKNIHEIIKNNFVLNEKGEVNQYCVPIERKDINADAITHDLLKLIAGMIVGDYSLYMDKNNLPRIKYHFQEKYSAMIQLLHSDLDADNLDYLLRDSTFSGTRYGIVDTSSLLSWLTATKISIDGESDIQYLIGIDPKGIGCVEQFFYSKYLAYTQMIFSKYVSSLESMLLYWSEKELIRDKHYGILFENNKGSLPAGFCDILYMNEVVSYNQKKSTNDMFIRFTDSYILQRIGEDAFTKGKKSPLKEVESHLVHYSAFALSKQNTSEEKRIINSEEKSIKDSFMGTKLYKEYRRKVLQFIERNKPFSEESMRQFEKLLLSFKFETRKIVKEKTFQDFNNQFSIDKVDDLGENIIQMYKRINFYRLAEGVAIIPKSHDDYCVKIVNNRVVKEIIPKLIVDSEESVMGKIKDQEYISLRKYDVVDYRIDDKV